MKIEIESVAKDGPRKLVVSDGDKEVFSTVAADLAGAHKIARAGLKHGWDSDEVQPAKPKPAK